MLGVVLSFMLMFIPNYLERVGISLPTTSFYFLVCGFTACFVCGFAKNRFAHLLTSRTRVLIQAASTVLGLFLFALMPSAKMLVVSCAFMGIALGIHDYYYIYVLYLICNGKVKANLRKLAEYTVYLGVGIMLPIIMAAFMVKNVRITFLILTVIVAILAFVYPLSSFSGKIDERDISLKPEKKQKPSAPSATRAPQLQNAAPVQADSQLPSGYQEAAPAPQSNTAVPEQQYYSQQYQAPVQQYAAPAQQYSEPVQSVPNEQQYQQPAEPYQQYQQPAEQQYQDPDQYAAPQQYAAPAQQYADPADPYMGSAPAPDNYQPQQAPYDPLAFLNGDENEGGNQNV